MQTLKNRLSKSRKENKGFTLVELIVVVVILAIIIGVAITGIYKYVNKARVNTDINNASAIQSALAVLATEKDVIAATDKEYSITWSKALSKTAGVDAVNTGNEVDKITVNNTFSSATPAVDIAAKIDAILSDGVPEAKAGGCFKLTVKNTGGSVAVSCKAYGATVSTLTDSTNPLTAQD